jgi:hypothetical protein
MTAATLLAVYYATGSKVLRRKVVPDNDALLKALSIPPGESVLLLPLAQPYDDASCRTAIAAATGAVVPSGRCCVIDDDWEVIGICNGDPALDTHPNGQLVASDHAGPGDRYVAGVFLRRYPVANHATNVVALTAWLPISHSTQGLSLNLIREPGGERSGDLEGGLFFPRSDASGRRFGSCS